MGAGNLGLYDAGDAPNPKRPQKAPIGPSEPQSDANRPNSLEWGLRALKGSPVNKIYDPPVCHKKIRGKVWSFRS